MLGGKTRPGQGGGDDRFPLGEGVEGCDDWPILYDVYSPILKVLSNRMDRIVFPVMQHSTTDHGSHPVRLFLFFKDSHDKDIIFSGLGFLKGLD